MASRLNFCHKLLQRPQHWDEYVIKTTVCMVYASAILAMWQYPPLHSYFTTRYLDTSCLSPMPRRGRCRLAMSSTYAIRIDADRLLSCRSRQRERLSASVLSICSSVCLSVCLSVCQSPKCKKTRFSQTLSNLELWSLLTTYRKSYMGFSKNLLSKMDEIRHL